MTQVVLRGGDFSKGCGVLADNYVSSKGSSKLDASSRVGITMLSRVRAGGYGYD